MKIQEIIDLLKVDGRATKRVVLNRLQGASIDELLELRQSVNERIILEKRKGNKNNATSFDKKGKRIIRGCLQENIER